MENMHIKNYECHQEESCRYDAFEVAQEECFRLVLEHMNAQDTNFNNISMYATEKFNQTHQNITFNHCATQTGINNMIHYQNENHHHYQQFYKETCDLWDVEYGNNGVA